MVQLMDFTDLKFLPILIMMDHEYEGTINSTIIAINFTFKKDTHDNANIFAYSIEIINERHHFLPTT